MYVRNTDPPGPKSKEVIVQGHTLYGYYNTPKSHYYVEYSFCIVQYIQGITFSYIHILFYIYVLRICIPIPKSGPGANEITYHTSEHWPKTAIEMGKGQGGSYGGITYRMMGTWDSDRLGCFNKCFLLMGLITEYCTRYIISPFQQLPR